MDRIFLLGMPRSGTTILLQLLSQNGIKVVDEQPEHLPTSDRVDKLLESYPVAQKYPKQCLNTPSLIKRFPKAKFIFLYKQLENQVRSYENHFDSKILSVDGVDGSDPKEIWAYYINSILPYVYYANCLLLRFEDLINKKEETIEKIFRFLRMPIKESVREFANNKITNKSGRLQETDAFGKPYDAVSYGGIK